MNYNQSLSRGQWIFLRDAFFGCAATALFLTLSALAVFSQFPGLAANPALCFTNVFLVVFCYNVAALAAMHFLIWLDDSASTSEEKRARNCGSSFLA